VFRSELILIAAAALLLALGAALQDTGDSPPFTHSADADCASCHTDAGSPWPSLAEFRGKDCGVCHSDTYIRSNFTRWTHKTRPAALSGKACLDCHAISDGGGVALKAKGDALCLSCHADARDEFRGFSSHPYFEGNVTCLRCHPAHGDYDAPILLEQVQFWGDAAVPLYDSMEQNAECLRCHPYFELTGLSRSGFVLANTFNLHELHLERALTACIECHEPHGSSSQKLVRSALPDGSPLVHVGGEGWGTCSVNCHSTPHIQTKYGSDPVLLSQ
jgi:predicted CXXCH cytochrome family protein